MSAVPRDQNFLLQYLSTPQVVETGFVAPLTPSGIIFSQGGVILYVLKITNNG
jgi:hypothetical protein